MKEVYWVWNAMQSDIIKEKQKQTVLERYKETNVSKVESVKQKRANTMRERTWYNSVLSCPEIQEKIKATTKKNHGVEYPFQSKTIRDKAAQTFKNKHWWKLLFETEEFKSYNIEYNMEKHWVPYHCMTEVCKVKSQKDSKVNQKARKKITDAWIDIDWKDYVIWEYEYDIKIWSILLELNPSRTHSSSRAPNWRSTKPVKYHLEKSKVAEANWYKCIHVFDWDDFNKIISLLNPNKETIYARNCNVTELTYDDCNLFFETYHLQWNTKKNKNNVYIWLYYDNELVECMSFGKPRFNKNYEWEILRLCSHKDYNIIWWASKIFKYFIKNKQPTSVISYCDKSKFDWKVYEQMWFRLDLVNSPSRHWIFNWSKSIWCPIHLTDNLIRKHWFDQIVWKYFWWKWKWTPNDVFMREAWYIEVYDCWQARYTWCNKKKEN